MRILRWLAAAAVVAAVLTAIVWLAFTRWRTDDGAAWTSRSGEALDELQLGIEDFSRRYWIDAYGHLERAVELDPRQAGGLLHLFWLSEHDEDEAQALMNRLLALDDEDLNDRERFLIAYHHARSEGETSAAASHLAAFRAEHPEDLYGLLTECEVVYHAENWAAAEACYRKVLEAFPNWLEAHDVLGFIAMAQGRFDEAEAHFRAYRFVAPEQARPYSSLGQLLVLLGEYEEAQDMLLRALDLKDDYCEAMVHLFRLYVLAGEPADALQVIDRLEAEPACDWYEERGFVCSARAMALHWSGRDGRAQEILDGGCLDQRDGFDLTAHRLAVQSGDLDRALAIEDTLRGRIAAVQSETDGSSGDELTALLAHLEGVRQLATDDLPSAIESFRLADEMLGYWNVKLGTIKLFNRLHLAEALARSGRTAEASAVFRQIQVVNPHFADQGLVPGFESHLDSF